MNHSRRVRLRATYLIVVGSDGSRKTLHHSLRRLNITPQLRPWSAILRFILLH